MWLLDQRVFQAIEDAKRSGIQPTADQLQHIDARASEGSESGPRLLNIVGDKAEIAIEGVLTPRPDFFAVLFGGGNTTYSEIIQAVAEADRDPEVKEIILSVNSPGGNVDGMFDAIAAIQSTDTPVKSVVSGMAASAAYALVAASDRIEAKSRATMIGSIGVVATMRVSDEIVHVTSTNAPRKRPDVRTSEGQQMVRDELDALHNLFVETIADGRQTTSENVNTNFGQGATLLADDALDRGMIDGIRGASLAVVPEPAAKKATTAQQGGEKPEAFMDLEKLKAEHPDVYAAAVDVGMTQERDRVSAHLTMGSTSGDMDTAIAAINDGTEMTQGLMAKYMAAGMKKGEIDRRNDDSADAAAASEGTNGQISDADKDAKVGNDIMTDVAASFGVELSL